MGGHSYNIIVYGWAWVGMAANLLGMGGHGCNLKGKCGPLVDTTLNIVFSVIWYFMSP